MIRCPACGAAYSDDQTHCPEDGQRLARPAPHPDDVVGSVIGGRYRISGVLGAGGMGAVYVARHTGVGRDFAIKLMHPAAVNQRSIARFVREARAASRVDHDNVIGVIDFGQADEGYYFLVMEYVEGVSLDVELRTTGAFPIDRALRVLAQLASGLARAHELGIVHRDLKPENVLLCRRGVDRDFVKIIDFGLAKALGPEGAESPLTQEGEIFGTPEYMSPEQWRGASVDHRADIYAFGVLAYEMVTGHILFEGDIPSLMRAHLSSEPIPPHRRRERGPIPERLERLILAALAKDPEARPPSMDEVLTELRAIWDAQPTRAASLGDVPTLQLVAPDTLPDTRGGARQVLDGPALFAEIGRLHALRTRRLAELAESLWGARPPAEVAELQARLAALEARIVKEGEIVALLRDRLEESRRTMLKRQADVRGEIFDASLLIEDVEDDFDLRTTMDRRGAGDRAALTARRGAAERELVDLTETWDRTVGEAESELVGRLAQIHAMESEARPLVDRLSSEVQSAAKHRPELNLHLRELDRIRRAVDAFQALLSVLGSER